MEGMRAAGRRTGAAGSRYQWRRWMSICPRLGPRPVFDPHRICPPKPQKRIKVEDLDEALVMHKRFRPILKLKDLLEQSQGHVLNVHALGKLRDKLHIDKARRLCSYAREFPGILKLTTDADGWQWLELTDEAEEIAAEKEKFLREVHEPYVVRVVTKLLMMAKEHKLNLSRMCGHGSMFHFPVDFRNRVARSHPDYFRVVQESSGREVLELSSWRPELAVTAREQRIKDNSLELDELMGDTSPHAFTMHFPKGYGLKRRAKDYFDEWQRLPFPSPYEPAPPGMQGLVAEKRSVAIVHELLSLSIEKQARLHLLAAFRREFRVTAHLRKLVHRHQGVFYTSYKEDEYTVFLKEAFSGMRLLDRSPLLDFRDRFVRLCLSGGGGGGSSSQARPLDPERLRRQVREMDSIAMHHCHLPEGNRLVRGLRGPKGAMRRALARGHDVLLRGEEKEWFLDKPMDPRDRLELARRRRRRAEGKGDDQDEDIEGLEKSIDELDEWPPNEP